MARLIHYEDLALAIEPDHEGGYRVHTLRSPYGSAASRFTLLLHRKDLETMIQEVGDGLLRRPPERDASPARQLVVLDPGAEPAEPRATFQVAGARLFNGLFRRDIRRGYLLSRGRAEALPDRGLRIRIVLPADTEEAALLQSLPWELLYDKKTGDFLARNVLTPVVRQLALSWVSAPFPEVPTPRLRILIAVANPPGFPPLDDGDERARILEAWCHRQGAEVKVLPQATHSALYEALRFDHYQVLHFVAHGCFDAETGVGSLVLMTRDGEPDFVPGSQLAETLRASRELRLVFLNSCESAQVGHRPGQDPLLGLAAALVRGGMPAVIAMQFPVSDEAARVFSEAVYRSLAHGNPLDAAVADGRLALYREKPGSWEWITPVLVTALSESEVFRPLCTVEEARAAAREQNVPPPEITFPRAPYKKLCGREKWLAEILGELRDPNGNPVIAIHGMGGIGKTALAHEAVRGALGEGLFTTALWLQATKPVVAWTDYAVAPSISMTFEDVLDGVLQQWGPAETMAGGIEAKTREVERLLKRRKAILVLDNMETAQEAQEEVVRRLLPILAATLTRVVVTSRKRFETLGFSVALAGLEAGAAREFLLLEAHYRNVAAVYRASEKVLDQIATEVGGSPLAMKLVVGQLQILPVRRVLERLKSVRLQSGEFNEEDIYEKFYQSLFWHSWKLLEENEDARDLLLLLSWYEPLQGTPRSRLLHASGMQEDPNRFDDAVLALWRFSLVESDTWEAGSGDIRFSLHPLTQTFVESFNDRGVEES